MNVWDIAEVSVPSVAFREYLPVLVNFKFENVATPPEAVARPPEIAPPTGPVAIVRVTDDVLLATIALVLSSTSTFSGGDIAAFTDTSLGCVPNASFVGVFFAPML